MEETEAGRLAFPMPCDTMVEAQSRCSALATHTSNWESQRGPLTQTASWRPNLGTDKHCFPRISSPESAFPPPPVLELVPFVFHSPGNCFLLGSYFQPSFVSLESPASVVEISLWGVSSRRAEECSRDNPRGRRNQAAGDGW